MSLRPRVVIVGGGFGGLAAAQALADEPVEVLLVDRNNFHLFQPLLYQVATGGLSPANISMPLRTILKKQRNARVLMAEVTDLNLQDRQVEFADGRHADFDYLIAATGASSFFFKNPEWELVAPGLKTVEDARRIRFEVLSAFEKAEAHGHPLAPGALTMVVVGGGPTGVEMAGAIAELARLTMRGEFRSIHSEEARILLIENGPRVLGSFDPASSAHALASLRQIGVEVRLETMVREVHSGRVVLELGGVQEDVPCAVVVWAAGVRASRLAQVLAEKAGLGMDRGGRVPVMPDGSLPGFPEVFAVGDMTSLIPEGATRPLPGLAPVAQQLARHVAGVIGRRVRGEASPPAFAYVDRGNMATIGRASAVAETYGMKLSGFLAWLAWLFIHLVLLIGFQNRLLVLLQWAINFLTFNRAARLINATATQTPQAPQTTQPGVPVHG